MGMYTCTLVGMYKINSTIELTRYHMHTAQENTKKLIRVALTINKTAPYYCITFAAEEGRLCQGFAASEGRLNNIVRVV